MTVNRIIRLKRGEKVVVGREYGVCIYEYSGGWRGRRVSRFVGVEDFLSGFYGGLVGDRERVVFVVGR